MSTDKSFDRWHKYYRHLCRNDARIAWDAGMSEGARRAELATRQPVGALTDEQIVAAIDKASGHGRVCLLNEEVEPARPTDVASRFARALLAASHAPQEAPEPAQPGAGPVDSGQVCQCTFRGRILGDGCDVCNPGLAAQCAAENLEDNRVAREG